MVLQTLGALRLGDSEFSRPKPLLLLAYLSLEGSKARRYLADLFFMDTADPLNSLSRALSYLRTEANVTVQADEQKVWTTLSCDAAEFINHADQKRFDKALELYQGPFLESLDLPLGSELEEWVYGTREYLAGRFRNVLLQLAEQEASKGNLSQATKHAERAYTLTGAPELEPDDIQRLYRVLQAGKSTLASKLKQEAEDFDIDLSGTDLTLPEVRETIRHNLPIRATSFVGRDLELVEIARQLANPDIRLLTLHGTGGIGKSRLAVQAAYDQLQQARGYNPLFTDGIFFVPLDALASADLIPATIAEALGLELQGQDDTLSQVIRFIGRKHLLLILDNYEHLMAGATLPSKLLSSCANLKLLVTSRERLNVEEEWVMTLEGLPVPGQEVRTFEEAQRFDALGLFVQRAKRARLDFTLSQDDLPHALKICQLVEGSPLGLELAAVWVKMMPLAEIAKEIESNLSFLTTTSRNVPHRHQSIKAAFEHSWKLLTEKEQEVLRKLSVFVGGFRREAAAEVAGATLPILASLVDKSLLRVSENGRYDRHVLLYGYVKEKAVKYSEDYELSQSKHLNYYFRIVSELRSKRDKTSFGIVDEELQNIQAATHWAVDTTNSKIIYQISELVVYFDTRAKFREGNFFFQRIIDKLIQKDLEDQTFQGTFYIDQAWFRFRLGHYSEALDLTQLGLSLAFSSDKFSEYVQMKGLNTLAAIETYKGNFAKAKSYIEKALEFAYKYQDVSRISLYLSNLAFMQSSLGQFSEAKHSYQKILEIDRQNKDYYRIVSNLDELGQLCLKINEPLEAKMYFLEGLELAQTIGFETEKSYLLSNLGIVHCLLKDYDNALFFCQSALECLTDENDPFTKSCLLTNAGRVLTAISNYKDARKILLNGLDTAWKANEIVAILHNFVFLAELLEHEGRSLKACELLDFVIEHPSSEVWIRNYAMKLSTTLKLPYHPYPHNQPLQNRKSELKVIIEELLAP
jgi:predicted ATPase/Tfp pilus assembly protein PilF